MAVIEAKVIKNSAGDIQLSASRKGGCSSCAQSKACALTWSPNTDDAKPVALEVANSAFNKQVEQIANYANLKVGDTVKLECDEQNLMKYICLLFLPSLMSLLLGSLLVSLLFVDDVPTFIVVVAVAGSLSLGASCSHYLLSKSSQKLLENTVKPIR